MDANGEMAIPFNEKATFEEFSEGRAVTNTWKGMGFIDTKGEMVIPPIYEKTESFSEGLAVIQSKGNFGYIDASGTVVLPPIFKTAFSFHEGLAYVETDDKKGFIKKPLVK